jgi:hypothetical protein
MIPDLDRERLAIETRAWLEEKRLSTRNASISFPGLNPAMISRACSCQILSAASHLALCAAMGVDPSRYLIFVDRNKQKQTVTEIGKRETSGAVP